MFPEEEFLCYRKFITNTDTKPGKREILLKESKALFPGHHYCFICTYEIQSLYTALKKSLAKPYVSPNESA